jgi:hypothetical protein
MRYSVIRHSSFYLEGKMLKRCFLFLVGMLMLSAMNLNASDLSFFVGGIIPGSINYNNVRTSLDNSPVWGIRYGTSFVRSFGMEHSLAFSSDYLFPRGISSINDAKGFVYNSNLIINIPVGNLIPYITAGAGMLHQYGDASMPVGSKFAFNYGGGVKLPRLVGPLGVRVDLRGYRAGIFSNKLRIFETSGGVMISMGK